MVIETTNVNLGFGRSFDASSTQIIESINADDHINAKQENVNYLTMLSSTCVLKQLEIFQTSRAI